MEVAIIAIHKAWLNITGFRIIDIDNYKVKDVTKEELLKAIRSKKISAANVKIGISGRTIEEYNGSFNRYPTICNSIVKEKYGALTVLSKGIDTVEVCDYNGNVRQYKIGELRNYISNNIIDGKEIYSLTNAKIIDNNGKLYISAIKGEITEKILLENTWKISELESVTIPKEVEVLHGNTFK